MSYADTDVFPQIWQSLTAERMAGLLSSLSPKVRNRIVSFTCPNCGAREAYVYESKDGRGPLLHCNRKNNCGHDETLWEFVTSQHGGDKKAALAELAGAAGVRLDETLRGAARPSVRRLSRPPLRVSPPAPDSPLLDAARVGELAARHAQSVAALPSSKAQDYLKWRGALRPELPGGFGFGFANVGPLAGRLTYPLRNKEGQIVALEGRAVSDTAKPKCRCDGEKDAGVFFVGERLRCDDLHICEGVMDACALLALNLNALALCGGGLPAWLVTACAFQRVMLAFDADKAGDGAAARWTEALQSHGSKVTRLRPPDEGRDWGDYLAEGLPALRDAYWQAQGVPRNFRVLRADFIRLQTQITFLQTHERNKKADRATLTARVETSLEDFAARCDLPGGYTDASDPYAASALDVLHMEIERMTAAFLD